MSAGSGSYPPGTIGLPCKVAVDLDAGAFEGAWRILGTAGTFSDAAAIEEPDGVLTFVTVEGLAEEMARDTFEVGYFEEAARPQEDRL